ncbi:MAG: HEPN domain-containing protein [Betaproteobacteria bacterium]|nr:HEPN domain-containing protein [Betaproteobacteria bacterium]
MPQLFKKQRELLAAYVHTFQVSETRRLDASFNLEYEALWNSIGRDGPWGEFLDEFDIWHIAQLAYRRVEGATVTGFTGPLDGNLIPVVEEEMRIFLESLPRPYFICFELPLFPRYGIAEIALGAGVSIIQTVGNTYGDLVEKPNTLRGLFSLGADQVEWRDRLKADTVYLRFEVPGYADRSLTSYSPARAFARLKHFLVLGFSSGVLRHRELGEILIENRSMDPTQTTIDVIAYNPDDYQRETYRLRLPDGASKHVRWFRINEDSLTIHDGKSGTTILGGRVAETSEDKTKALPSALSTTMRLQQLDESHKDADRIRAALEWYFDADTADNQTVAFLQRCIGLEAILGDDENLRTTPLTDRLADRYAYLMGQTASERIGLREHFRKVYGRRSDVVHSRRAAARIDFRNEIEAQTMLSNLIRKEVSGLLRTLKI